MTTQDIIEQERKDQTLALYQQIALLCDNQVDDIAIDALCNYLGMLLIMRSESLDSAFEQVSSIAENLCGMIAKNYKVRGQIIAAMPAAVGHA